MTMVVVELLLVTAAAAAPLHGGLASAVEEHQLFKMDLPKRDGAEKEEANGGGISSGRDIHQCSCGWEGGGGGEEEAERGLMKQELGKVEEFFKHGKRLFTSIHFYRSIMFPIGGSFLTGL